MGITMWEEGGGEGGRRAVSVIILRQYLFWNYDGNVVDGLRERTPSKSCFGGEILS